MNLKKYRMLMLLLVVLFNFETFNCTKVSAASKNY